MTEGIREATVSHDTRPEENPPAPVLAFIYDRRTSPTIGVLNMRLGFCRLRAEEQGWEVAGEWVDQGDSAFADGHRLAFDQMLMAIRDATSRGREALCLVSEWHRLSHNEDVESAFRARVAAAGGYTATAAGEDDRDEPRIGRPAKAAG
jgi:hypothetical protein